MTAASRTSTAPTGTSPLACAAAARSSATRMKPISPESTADDTSVGLWLAGSWRGPGAPFLRPPRREQGGVDETGVEGHPPQHKPAGAPAPGADPAPSRA